MPHLPPALLLLAAVSCAQAGTVTVRFIEPRTFIDAGFINYEQERTQKALAGHLVKLGVEILPEPRSLEIEVFDVDLAGDPPLIATRTLREARVLRGKADFPRITLHYTLREAGQVLREAREQIIDMGYLDPGRPAIANSQESFLYEKRMLSDWFKERFSPAP